MDDVEISLVEHSNQKKAGCSKIKLFILFSSAFLLWLIITFIVYLPAFKSSDNCISYEVNENKNLLPIDKNKEKVFLLQKAVEASDGEEIGLID
jgi:hypothetical protein